MDGFMLSVTPVLGLWVSLVLVAIAMSLDFQAQLVWIVLRKFFLIPSTWEVHKMHATWKRHGRSPSFTLKKWVNWNTCLSHSCVSDGQLTLHEPREANPKGITHVLNVSDLYVLPPGTTSNLLSEWVSWRICQRWAALALCLAHIYRGVKVGEPWKIVGFMGCLLIIGWNSLGISCGETNDILRI